MFVLFLLGKGARESVYCINGGESLKLRDLKKKHVQVGGRWRVVLLHSGKLTMEKTQF